MNWGKNTILLYVLKCLPDMFFAAFVKKDNFSTASHYM